MHDRTAIPNSTSSSSKYTLPVYIRRRWIRFTVISCPHPHSTDHLRSEKSGTLFSCGKQETLRSTRSSLRGDDKILSLNWENTGPGGGKDASISKAMSHSFGQCFANDCSAASVMQMRGRKHDSSAELQKKNVGTEARLIDSSLEVPSLSRPKP